MRVSSGKSSRSLHFDCGTVSTIGRDHMKLPRRQFLRLTAGAVALPAIARIAWAQSYPSRPVRMSSVPRRRSHDIIARLIAQWLSSGWASNSSSRTGRAPAATSPPRRSCARRRRLHAPSRMSPNAINATLYEKLNFNFSANRPGREHIRETPMPWRSIHRCRHNGS